MTFDRDDVKIIFDSFHQVKGLSLLRTTSGVGGSCGIGSISALGSSVTGFSSSDLVFFVQNGSWAKEVVVPASQVIKLPPLNAKQQSVLPAAISAYSILTHFKTLSPKDSVVQFSSGTSVSSAIATFGKLYDLNVVNVTDQDLSDIKSLSAKFQTDIKLVVSSTSKTKNYQTLMKLLAPGGALVTYNDDVGNVDIDPIDAPIRAFIFSDVSVHGFDLIALSKSNPTAFASLVANAANLVSKGKLDTLVSREYPVAEFASAIADKTVGISKSLVW